MTKPKLSTEARQSIDFQMGKMIRDGMPARDGTFDSHPIREDLAAALATRMREGKYLETLARNAPPEEFVLTMETWARACGAIFAETVRGVFRAVEEEARREMQDAMRERRDAMSAHERDVKLLHFKNRLETSGGCS